MADRIKNYQQEADQITTLKAICTDLGVTSSSYTPDATVVTKDRVVTFAQAEEELVVLSDIEKGVKQQVTEVDIAQKDIANIKALLQGHLYDYQTDSTEAYKKSVPAGAMPYAGLEQIGGKTIVMNQLVQNGNFADGTTGWSAVSAPTYGSISVSDGVLVYTIGSTIADNNYSNVIQSYLPTIRNHKYLIRMSIKLAHTRGTYCWINGTGGNQQVSLGTCVENVWNDVAAIFTRTGGVGTHAELLARNAYQAGYSEGDIDYLKNVICIDLTLMFGSGNEPSTVAEFEAMFPANYYAYNEGELLSAGVTSVVSKDSNNATLQTIPIPTAIRNLEGYGWSAGYGNNELSNYIDFERKVYVQNVARVDLGTLTWAYSSGYNFPTFDTYITGGKGLPTRGASYTIGLCDKYAWLGNTINTMTNVSARGDKGIGQVERGDSRLRVLVTDSAYTDAATFKSAMSGVYLYYELSEPVETDISAYLTDDNLISVESGGTLTFENQHGDDYQIHVPSEETYMIDLQSAIGV